MTWSTGSLARRLAVACEGPEDRALRGVASLERATSEDLAFCVGGRFLGALAATRAGAVLVPAGVAVPPDVVALRTDHPRYAFARASAWLSPEPAPPAGRHPTAVVDPTAQLGEGVALEPYVIVGAGATVGAGTWLQGFVYVGRGAQIGAGCRLQPGVVVLDGAVLGDRVLVHPGAVIGADGFGHVPGPEGVVRMPHRGRVVIGDDVEIGANTCVDRAVLDETRIERGSRLDNLVQIAHGVRVGAESLLAAFVGVAGGAELGARVIMGGRSAVVDGVKVGAGAVFAGLASASKDVPAGARIGGSPARSYRRWLREVAALQQLPDLLREVEHLKRRIAALEKE